MDKPIVFFSHSTKDKDLMLKLKELIDIKTSETISIFLSSDGQSIPLGSNWVHEVEKALTKTSLMFVFISPNSLFSNWLYFEAGYVYSKEIHVVPVGILGVDLSQLPPPLSLLQGFNIKNKNSLENIIVKINSTYGTKFDSKIDNEQYINIL